MRRLLAIAIAVVATGAVAGSVLATGGESAGRALAVDLDEWTLTASDSRVKAGTVDVTQTNSGKVDHELLIVRTRTAPDELPIGLSGVRPSLAGKLVYGVEHSHHAGGAAPAGADHLRPNETRRAKVRLTPGRYVLLCGLEGHYQAGQRAALTVE